MQWTGDEMRGKDKGEGRKGQNEEGSKGVDVRQRVGQGMRSLFLVKKRCDITRHYGGKRGMVWHLFMLHTTFFALEHAEYIYMNNLFIIYYGETHWKGTCVYVFSPGKWLCQVGGRHTDRHAR